VSGDDPAVWRRLRVIPFDVVIPPEERDPHLDEKLQAEADAVLAGPSKGGASIASGASPSRRRYSPQQAATARTATP